MKKLNNKGFSHHLLLPALVVMLIAAVGTYVLQKSRAGVAYTNGPIYTGNSFVRPDGSKEEFVGYQNLNTIEDGYMHDTVFNPDGSRIAYVQTKYGDGLSVLKTAKSDGSDVRELYRFSGDTVETGSGISRPTWSSDGKYVAFFYGSQGKMLYPGNGTLMVVRSDGNTTDDDSFRALPVFPEGKTELWFSGSGIQFIPGTTKIAYIVSQYATYEGDPIPELCNVDLSVATEPSCMPITGINKNTGFYPGDFRVSNTGNGLFITRQARPGPDTSYDEQFYKLNLATATAQTLGAVRQTANVYYYDFAIEWSPDGARIAYQDHYQHVTDPARAGTFVMDENGQNIKKISEESGSYALAWQPIPVGGTQSPLPTDKNSVSCTIDGPIGGKFVANKPNQIKVTLTNHSIGNVATSIKGDYSTYATSSPVTGTFTPTTVNIPADGSVEVNLSAITVPYGTSSSSSISVVLQIGNSGQCGQTFPLPVPPLTLDGPTTRTVTYGKSFVVTGRTAPSRQVYIHNKTVPSNTTGLFSHSLSTTQASLTYNAQLVGTYFYSPKVTAKTSPAVNGALTKKVSKNSTVVITGKYIPNTTIKLHMRKPGDPAGKYPTTANVRVNASGSFSYSYKANTKKSFYFSAPNGTKTPVYTYSLQ